MSMAATESSMKMKKMTMRTCEGDELRREASNINNVSEYEGYHGDERASVPFRWESQPGTPKHAFRYETTLIPPLTPPPSYYSSRSIVVKAHHHKNNMNSSASSKSNLLQSMLPKRTSRKAHAPSPTPLALSFSSSPSSSSSSSSSYQSRQRSRSVPSTPLRRRPRKDKKEDDEEVDLYDAHASGLCFRGCYSSMVNKLLLPDFL